MLNEARSHNAKSVADKSPQSSGNSIFRPRSLETMMYSLDVSKIFHGIVRHIPLVLLFAVVGALLGSYISYRLSNVYYTESILIYQKEPSNYKEMEFQILRLSMSAAVEMITLPAHLKAVKSLLGLNMTIEELEKMITVDPPLKESNLITITVKATEPSLAISIANSLAQVVVQNSRELSQKQWQDAYLFFKREEDQLKQQLEQQDKEIFQFRKEHSYIGLDPESLSPLQKLSQSEEQLQSVSLEYNKAKSEYEAIAEEWKKMPDHIQAPSEDEQLTRQRISRLEDALLNAQSKYAAENPKLKGLEMQLSKLRQNLAHMQKDDVKQMQSLPNPEKNNLNLQLIALQARVSATGRLKDEMENIVGKMRSGLEKLSQEQVELLALLHKKTQLDIQVKTAVDRERAIRVIQNLGKSDIELYEQASKAFGETIPFMVILLPSLGFILGSILGIGGASALELFDKKYRTPKELDNVFITPTFEMIPQKKVFKKYDADDQMLPYVRNIIERINRLPEHTQVINITSSTRREGKTTISHYLARYYSKIGKKVIILGLDCHEDSLFPADQVPPELIESYLKGKASFEDIIFHGPPDKIICRNDPAMQELVRTEGFHKLMQLLRKTYDIIIVDSPGITEEIYGINLTEMADTTLFVIGSSIVTKKHVNSVLEKMNSFGVKPDGFVLNRVLPVYIDDVCIKAQMSKGRRWGLFGR